MGKFAIRVLGPKADGMPSRQASRTAPFLERFDFDAHDGRGAAYTTSSAAKAKTFASGTEAFFWYREPSPRKPPGWDPKEPYVPMSAYSLAIVDLSQEEEAE